MKTLCKVTLIVCLLIGTFGSKIQAQEYNFSQYQNTPFLTNPGMIASTNDAQLLINYRNQPVEANQNFSTFIVSGSYPFSFGHSKNHKIAAGLSVIGDKATNFLKTNGVIAALAYNIRTSRLSYLSFGMQAGFFQKRVDLDGLTTDSQYDLLKGTFNSGASLNEPFDNASKSYPVISSGVFWHLEDGLSRQKAFFGLSLFNMNKPDVAFVIQDAANLSADLIMTGGYNVYQSLKFSVMPTFRFTSRATGSQMNVGSWFRYHVGDINAKGSKKDGTLGMGLWYNTANAAVVSFEFNQPNYVAAISYDLPTSTIGKDIRGSGILEFTIGLKMNSKFAKKKIGAKKSKTDKNLTTASPIDESEGENTEEEEKEDNEEEDKQ